MASLNIRSGDLVQLQVGDSENRNKKGRVISVNPEKQTVTVESLRMVTRHRKPRNAQDKGGKIQIPSAINVSNVMLVCPSCGKPTRVKHVLGEKGKYVRACKQCGAVIDAKAEKKQAKEAKKTAAKKTTAKKTTAKKTATKKAVESAE